MQTKKIVIVDFGAGNTYNIKRAIEYCGYPLKITSKPEDINKAAKLIIPGVGAFPSAIKYLRKHGLDEAIHNYNQQDKPILGICLGMQLLFEKSDEFETTKGLGLLKGNIKKIPNKNLHGKHVKTPHIGWNKIIKINYNFQNETIRKCLTNKTSVYFLHSFMANVKVSSDLLAYTLYESIRIPAIVNRKNIWGFQFHPEKSGQDGLKLIRAFLDS